MFGYDDGRPNSVKLEKLFNDCKVKVKFYLDGKCYFIMTESESNEVSKIFERHEIACHTVHSGFSTKMQTQGTLFRRL